MKPDKMYQNLKDLSEQLNTTVMEKNFRNTGIKVKSGFCRIKNKDFFFLDKHKSVHEKIEILASLLVVMPLENIFIIPAVRDLLNRYNKPDRRDKV